MTDLRFAVTIDEKVWTKYVKRQARKGIAALPPAEMLEALIAQALAQDSAKRAEDEQTSTSIMMVLGRVKVEHHP
jgi:hypothetical protein